MWQALPEDHPDKKCLLALVKKLHLDCNKDLDYIDELQVSPFSHKSFPQLFTNGSGSQSCHSRMLWHGCSMTATFH